MHSDTIVIIVPRPDDEDKNRSCASVGKITSARTHTRLIRNIRRDGAGRVLEYGKRNYKIGDTASILVHAPIIRILACAGIRFKNTRVEYMNHKLAARGRLRTARDSKFGDEELI
jgi:hypothetical protein